MKIKLIATVMFTATMAAAGPACAQYLKPGLWETRISTPGKGDGSDPMVGYVARMKKEMATMDPEMRKEMETMLADLAAKGTGFDRGGFHSKMCISKDEVQDLDRLLEKKGNCSTRRSALVGGQIKLTTNCTNPQSAGTAVIKLQGDTGYTLEGNVTTSLNGQPMTQQVTSSGKWLASDCGAIKPGRAAD